MLALKAETGSVSSGLNKFVVPQQYDTYLPTDQETWFHVITALKECWQNYAHTSFLEGLEKTRINPGEIPRIAQINDCLRPYGWGAVVVSGFIPPDAFMEFHAQGVLPIAREIRKPENMDYTPAPDIIHEAAGHAPLLTNRDYGQFLKHFGSIARQVTYTDHDYEVYEAVRHLSQVKEDRRASSIALARAQERLKSITLQSQNEETSTGARLSRLFWWTIEYGLIGPLENPKLYGAGLLSSLEECQTCLSPEVRKLPLSLECLDVPFDITQPQPQLFVIPQFKALSEILEAFSNRYLTSN